jgi:5-methylcytosine-specific restriction protein A
MREVPEWIGKTLDAKIPPRVRLRIFEHHDGRCHITGRKIQAGEAWDCEHIKALCNGGEHRESNLAPALKQPHREKTARDVKLKAKTDRIRKRHLGIKKQRTITAWRRMNGEKVFAGRER